MKKSNKFYFASFQIETFPNVALMLRDPPPTDTGVDLL
jgi:hypothetical protein